MCSGATLVDRRGLYIYGWALPVFRGVLGCITAEGVTPVTADPELGAYDIALIDPER